MISTNFLWFDRSQTDQTMRCRHHSPFPAFKGCEACRTQPGCYRRQGRPHQGETHKVHRSRVHTKLRQAPLLVPGYSTRPNCPHGPRHAVSPHAAFTSTHQCPLHQPGPLHAGQVTTAPHTHAPARPTPCKCRRCPMPIPVPCSPDSTAGPQHKATTQHCPAAPTLRLGGRTTGRGRTPTLIPPTTHAAHTPQAICWRCWRAGRTREFGR
jgi:hypothetical protein